MADMIQNVTTGLSSVGEMGTGLTWLFAIVIFGATILTIFLVSKNFRRFIYGGITTGILIGVGFFSKAVANETVIEQNYEPIKWVVGIIAFILVSIGVGILVQKTSAIKKFEDSFKEEVTDKIDSSSAHPEIFKGLTSSITEKEKKKK